MAAEAVARRPLAVVAATTIVAATMATRVVAVLVRAELQVVEVVAAVATAVTVPGALTRTRAVDMTATNPAMATMPTLPVGMATDPRVAQCTPPAALVRWLVQVLAQLTPVEETTPSHHSSQEQLGHRVGCESLLCTATVVTARRQ